MEPSLGILQQLLKDDFGTGVLYTHCRFGLTRNTGAVYLRESAGHRVAVRQTPSDQEAWLHWSLKSFLQWDMLKQEFAKLPWGCCVGIGADACITTPFFILGEERCSSPDWSCSMIELGQTSGQCQ
jgi:hypothetical protein